MNEHLPGLAKLGRMMPAKRAAFYARRGDVTGIDPAVLARRN
ncbi:hypothetical protein [Paracoccus sp. (in: a-proteobacteria)]